MLTPLPTGRGLQAPQADEFEVTILGRGYGESLVIHMGDSRWIVVDSFTFGSSVAPVDYLDRMGVPPQRIDVILATHWHDDHVRGLARLYELADRAELAFSIALRADEFTAFVHQNGKRSSSRFTSGVTELMSVNEINRRENRAPVLLVGASQIIFQRHPEQTSFGLTAQFTTLSPSPGDVVDFLTGLASEQLGRSASREKRNAVSVVGWAAVGESSALLGADLENSGDDLSGWTAIVNSTRLPRGKAQVFKIPHHGSKTGHNTEVWKQLIEDSSIAALAPWQRGRKLPKNTDIFRIKEFTNKLFTARDRIETPYKAGPSPVDKMLRASNASLTSIVNDYGYVQMRCKVGGVNAWSIRLGGGAKQL